MSTCFERTWQRSFGTWPLKGPALHAAVLAAAGYRAFDTAQMYENEAETGAALQATGIVRDDPGIAASPHMLTRTACPGCRISAGP